MFHLPQRWGEYRGLEDVYSDLKLLYHDKTSNVEAEFVFPDSILVGITFYC
jgi:hypothetical protein